ncbi:MAG: hypothetical protein J6A41_03650 [Ruminiclostridium sp.]|nr:hypothetical protein [Ruminiclostridium sp.]
MENEVLTSAVCPTCGAPLKVIDEEKGTMQCEYCGGTSIDNRHTFTHVSRDFASELEYELTNADALIESGYYDKAFYAYNELMNKHSADWRVWWGMLRSRTQNFLLVNVNSNDFQTAEHYYNTAMKHIPEEKKKECEAVYEKWKGLVFAYNKAIADAYKRYKAGRRIIAFVFFAAFVAFLVFYYIVVNQHFEAALGDLDPTALGFVFLSLPIFTFVLGIAAIICKVGYVNVYMNLSSLGCSIMFVLADPQLSSTAFNSFEDTLMFAIYVFMGFIIFQITTLISRIPAKIAKNRS